MVRYILLFLVLLTLPIHAQEKRLKAFIPEHGNNMTAVIVCPGGSYSWLDYRTEGKGVVKWLNANGIAAFVLKYPVQGKFQYVTHSRLIFGGHKHPDMINSLQDAIRYVREHASEYNINPNRVGAMGFSAGGHLVMSAAEFFDSPEVRPDFVAPIYPVVTMSEKVAHKRSRRALLGEKGKKDRALRDSLSLEKHVPADCPPVFLVNCRDDHVVKYQNSVLLDSALTAMGIKHEYIQYKTGGHGFGASNKKGTPECRQWKSAFLEWLKENIEAPLTPKGEI